MATRRMTMQPLVALRDYSVFMTNFLALLLKHILSMAERLSSSLEKKAGVWFGPAQVGRELEQEPCWFEAARANVCSQDMEMEKVNLFTETCFNCNISDEAAAPDGWTVSAGLQWDEGKWTPLPVQHPSLWQQNNTPKYVSITSDRLKVYIWCTLLTRPETEREPTEDPTELLHFKLTTTICS